ncbi:sensor histidine kinase [Plantactinospora sp. B5E13]|uniref:sensor histidine kinase n=1 Tax=unclassified Plantactinospora TaxID=2631981 RepID=UPI00325F790C
MGRFDVPLALAVAVAVTVATEVSAEPAERSSPVVAGALGLAVGGLLLLRHRRPVLVLVLSLVAVMTYNLTDFPSISPIWPLLVPLYAVARAGQPLIGAAIGTSTLLVSTGWVLHAGVGPLELLDGVLREAAILGLALMAGAAVRARELLAREAHARLAAEQEQRGREAARLMLAERIRIARELHDVTAHTVTVVGVQLNLARELLDVDPDAAREVLDGARQINGNAIDELQSAVRLLREPGTGPDRQALPDETQLDALLDRAADTGLRASLQRIGRSRPLPPAVGLTVYRITQEAVTNVLRHAHATRVVVTLRYAADGVHLDITDDGTPPAPAGTDPPSTVVGHGLPGMRERADSLGGTLDAGPAPTGGYTVRAWLPLPAASPVTPARPSDAPVSLPEVAAPAGAVPGGAPDGGRSFGGAGRR